MVSISKYVSIQTYVVLSQEQTQLAGQTAVIIFVTQGLLFSCDSTLQHKYYFPGFSEGASKRWVSDSVCSLNYVFFYPKLALHLLNKFLSCLIRSSMRATPFLLFILYLVYCVKIFDFRLNECKQKLNANLNEHKIEVIFLLSERKKFSIHIYYSIRNRCTIFH